MGKKILLIEDEKQLVELLMFRLEANGYEVVCAYDGQEGLTKIMQLKPDLAILDIRMPGMHGYDVCRLAKENEETKGIPIIILTAHTQGRDVDEAKNAGADAFVAKPFEPEALLTEIRRRI